MVLIYFTLCYLCSTSSSKGPTVRCRQQHDSQRVNSMARVCRQQRVTPSGCGQWCYNAAWMSGWDVSLSQGWSALGTLVFTVVVTVMENTKHDVWIAEDSNMYMWSVWRGASKLFTCGWRVQSHTLPMTLNAGNYCRVCHTCDVHAFWRLRVHVYLTSVKTVVQCFILTKKMVMFWW